MKPNNNNVENSKSRTICLKSGLGHTHGRVISNFPATICYHGRAIVAKVQKFGVTMLCRQIVNWGALARGHTSAIRHIKIDTVSLPGRAAGALTLTLTVLPKFNQLIFSGP